MALCSFEKEYCKYWSFEKWTLLLFKNKEKKSGHCFYVKCACHASTSNACTSCMTTTATSNFFFFLKLFCTLEGVWYMHLKTENMFLKTCVKIRVGKKVYKNTCNVV